MNPNDWIYHLSLRTTLDRNDFLDSCPRTHPRRAQRRDRVRPAPGARRLAAVGAGVLVPLAALVAAVLHG